jgi:hypothetical protein
MTIFFKYINSAAYQGQKKTLQLLQTKKTMASWNPVEWRHPYSVPAIITAI